jgi:hypothetical protein
MMVFQPVNNRNVFDGGKFKVRMGALSAAIRPRGEFENIQNETPVFGSLS